MAAGNRSAAIRAYYAGPGNKFWRILADIGLTPELLQPSQFHSLLNFGIGLTDVAKYASGNDVDISISDRDPWAVRAKILYYSPKIFAFNGKAAAATFYKCKTGDVKYGLQGRCWGLLQYTFCRQLRDRQMGIGMFHIGGR